MSDESDPEEELLRRGLKLLYEGLGHADALRFLGRFAVGHGDYTQERDALYGHLTMEELTAELLAEEKLQAEEARGGS